jgi:hypothetical protein
MVTSPSGRIPETEQPRVISSNAAMFSADQNSLREMTSDKSHNDSQSCQKIRRAGACSQAWDGVLKKRKSSSGCHTFKRPGDPAREIPAARIASVQWSGTRSFRESLFLFLLTLVILR